MGGKDVSSWWSGSKRSSIYIYMQRRKEGRKEGGESHAVDLKCHAFSFSNSHGKRGLFLINSCSCEDDC